MCVIYFLARKIRFEASGFEDDFMMGVDPVSSSLDFAVIRRRVEY